MPPAEQDALPAVPCAVAPAEPDAPGKPGTAAEPAAPGDTDGVSVADTEPGGDGCGLTDGLPYAAAGNCVRVALAAADARAAAAWLADVLGPPENSQASTASTASPPPRMKTRRRQ